MLTFTPVLLLLRRLRFAHPTHVGADTTGTLTPAAATLETTLQPTPIGGGTGQFAFASDRSGIPKFI